MQDAVWEYLKQHPCQICGQPDPVLLEFDHLDGKEKENNISSLMSNATNVDILFKEIEKCQVLCSYCHKRKTAKQFRTWKYLKNLEENALVAQWIERHGPNVEDVGSTPTESTI